MGVTIISLCKLTSHAMLKAESPNTHNESHNFDMGKIIVYEV